MARTHPLTDWFKSKGVQLHWSLYLKEDPVTGLSFYTSAPIPKHTTAVTVPASLCITPEVAHRHICELLASLGLAGTPHGPLDVGALPQSDWILLYLVLCRLAQQYLAQHQNDQGHWADCLVHIPYVSHIPTVIPTPLHFSNAELTLLSNTHLRVATKHRFLMTKRTYARASILLHGLLESSGHEFASYIVKMLDTTSIMAAKDKVMFSSTWVEGLELWRWAESVLTSRAFPSKQIGIVYANRPRKDSYAYPWDAESSRSPSRGFSAPVLIPAYDMFNHARRPIARAYISSPAEVSTNEAPEGLVAMVLNYETPVAGTQVFSNYGSKSNEAFLAAFGFTLPTTSNDTLPLKLCVDGIDVPGHDVCTLLYSLEYSGNSETVYWPNNDDQPNKEDNPPCPCELLNQLEERMPNGYEEYQEYMSEKREMEAKCEAAGELESMLRKRHKAFQKSQISVEEVLKKHRVLHKVPSTWNPRTCSQQIRASVRDHVLQYRAGQLEILKKALAWAKAEHEGMIAVTAVYSSDESGEEREYDEDRWM